MFSYGSGLTATMFSLRVNAGQHPFSVSNIVSILNIDEKLKARNEVFLPLSTLAWILNQLALILSFLSL